jgi:hypothetical protein
MFIWDVEEGNIKSFIEVKDDLAGGRNQNDRTSAKKSTKNKHMTSVALSPNGEFVIGEGNSKKHLLIRFEAQGSIEEVRYYLESFAGWSASQVEFKEC